MKRALSSRWLAIPTILGARLLGALLLILLTVSPALAGKPTVAILGLEVYDPSGNIDQPSTAVARDLTEGLRARAKAGSGPYQLATGSEKELIDEKLINGCDTEAVPCMAEIGKNLGADFLIYGRLEKKADGYVVTINLLDVTKKKFEKAKTPLMIPFTQKDAPAIAAAARRAYSDLVGTDNLGTLVVQANADRGTVLVDDAPRGNLASGTATISSLPEGRYRVAIEAEGFQRSPEIVVTIRGGEVTTQPVTLAGGGAAAGNNELSHTITGTTSSSKSSVWKPAFYGLTAVGLGLAGYSVFEYTQWKDDISNIPKPMIGQPSITPADCGGAEKDSPLAKVCSGRDRNIYTGIAAAGVGGLAVFAFYMAYMRDDATESRPVSTAGRRTRKRALSVTPIVSAQGGGATFQLDW